MKPDTTPSRPGRTALRPGPAPDGGSTGPAHTAEPVRTAGPARPRDALDRVTATVSELWRSLSEWWRSRPRRVRDVEFALVLTVLSFAEPLASVGARFGDLPTRHASVLSVALTLGQTLPLVLRTRLPAVCLALVGSSFAVHQASGCPQTFGSMGVYVALYSMGAYQGRLRRLLAVPSFAAYVAFCVVLDALGSPQRLDDYAVFGLALAAFWGAGAFVRARRADEAERRRLTALAATAAERGRLARELHDVVTHHVTAMVVQSDAAPFLTASPDRVTEALTAISGTGRRALAELRYLLGVLEATGESEPGQRAPARGDLRDLVEQTRMTGQPVELAEEGERPSLPIGAELAMYRLVQEALTNAVKYAAGHPTLVAVRYGRDRLDVEVTNEGPDDGRPGDDGPGPARESAHVSGGRGLGGLRERVGMLGGDFTAGPRPGGGFAVRAGIPTEGAS
ncbi:histidine kinase [Streptomyces sp. NBC_01186]|uniref:sensor histidine kinase n=1 Tax=Streptomyces sp. NBC_01186 TaxID=2903765 RepID=UPI002E15F359|nr:histidine kinase [Streptomyces sp. NBC_01186]